MSFHTTMALSDFGSRLVRLLEFLGPLRIKHVRCVDKNRRLAFNGLLYHVMTAPKPRHDSGAVLGKTLFPPISLNPNLMSGLGAWVEFIPMRKNTLSSASVSRVEHHTPRATRAAASVRLSSNGLCTIGYANRTPRANSLSILHPSESFFITRNRIMQKYPEPARNR